MIFVSFDFITLAMTSVQVTSYKQTEWNEEKQQNSTF